MPSKRQSVGTDGENLALSLLMRKGYRLVARHVTTRFGEIDLILAHEGALVFVEVRKRRGERFGSPEESIGPSKRDKLVRSALTYVQDKWGEIPDLRFDV